MSLDNGPGAVVSTNVNNPPVTQDSTPGATPVATNDDSTDYESRGNSMLPIQVILDATDGTSTYDGEDNGNIHSHPKAPGYSGDATQDLANLNTATLSGLNAGLSHANVSKISLQGAGRSIIRELTVDEELMSLKVRSLYNSGISPLEAQSSFGSIPSGSIRAGLEQNRLSAVSSRSIRLQADQLSVRDSIANSSRSLSGVDGRADFELAGGVEDWEDIDADDIDRYGFIMPKPRALASQSTKVNPTNRSNLKKSAPGPGIKTSLHRRRIRPVFTHSRHINVFISTFQSKSSPEMLTSPIAGSSERMKVKEVERVAKWHSMALKPSVLPTGAVAGGGTNFDFPTSNPKLVDRTWKGIPDCWRSAAWFSFLEASAKKQEGYKSTNDLIGCYHVLSSQNSPDDVQIDLDVPRTISSHIMFRRRYRGGQRLLFRVLHAISLYFPDVGYVQGMASLAATFLCYYDEGAAFVMLVRLFELRGLHTLYSNGFGGLMDALNDFDTEWLQPGHPLVSRKLETLGISVLSFGTRWYLTLFNYSIPFAAQLRIWDVFLLLGDNELGGTLDVLHATSAALIEGMKEVVLESDFEGAMKSLTNWIAIKDEDILMKHVKVEWKRRKRRGLFPMKMLSAASRPTTGVSRSG
ncbi:hypothetical protein TWF225_000756 [Orbilia oligospora]|uniref:Uncharacterized protein n=1 Tax=Orbilia oligospora TaxID=2813651 RepID=A0A7C8U747_ORBOL|nr:hypothetical protein TWF225_000756 [Orbilia oligospora]KAF3181023.1 hypothetical protein TWF751_010232 [Orbilia oligospora]KAF3230729.1 hypothetical protein TWF128_005289 [Orbilia oligospora]KAF3230730.1 hypothetical protein TWF128_005289 [Orbilia oligospora]KAF3266608.1 hypothetical protein TWF217_001397 [Orbilia oligospora]